MYRFISLILLLWLSFAQANAQSVDLTVQSTTVTSGETVCLDVYVDGFDDLISLQFGITYDPALLEFTEIDNINGGAINGLSIGNFGTPPSTPDGEIRFTWDDPTTLGESAPDGTRMFQVCFNVIGAGGNTTNVVIESLPTLTIEAFNASLNMVPVNSAEGVVTIEGGNNAPDLDVSVTSALGDQGTVVCISVRVSNFENMALFNHALTWNSSVATFSSISNVYPGLIGLNLASVEGPPSTPPGEIHFNWEDPTPPDGETIPDNSNLYQACFELTGNPGTSTFLRIETTPSQMVEAENEDGSVTVAASVGMLSITDDSGSAGLTVDVADLTVNEGDPACVTFSVEGFEDILAAQWGITWDTTKLQFDSISNLNPDLNGLSLGGFGTPPSTPNGEIRFSWDDPMAVGQSLPDGSDLFDVCFTAIGSAGMTSPVNAEDLTGFMVEVFDGNGDEIDVTTNNGSVTIEGTIPDTAFTINVNDVTVNPGDTACVQVTVENFEDLIALQHGITWDTNVLDFAEIRNINSSALQGLGPGSFGTPPGTMNGTIRFSWDDPTATGQSVPDGTVLYEVCFVAIGGDGSVSGVDISDLTNFMIEAYNTTDQIPVSTDSGSITIVDDDPGGSPDTLRVNGGSGMVPMGDTICVPVTAENFENLIRLQFGMTYNSSRLRFISIESFNASIEGLNIGNFVTPPTSAAGQIRFEWNDPDDSGETVPNGATLFEVCFEAIGSAGTTSFFNVLGLDAFPLQAQDTSGAMVPMVTTNGEIEITDMVDPDADLIITASDGSGEKGDTVCIDVTVENFNNLVVLQHALTWDTGILEFISIENIYGSLSGLSQGSFGTPPSTPNGQIRFSWDDPTATGQSVPDGTVLYQICFEILGNAGSSSDINIASVPGFNIEAIDADSDLINVVGQNGEVTVTGIPDGLTFDLGDATGCTGDTVCVDFTVNDFNNILVMQLPIVFDETAVEPVGVQNIFSTLPGLSTGSFGFTTPGEVRISWDDPNATGQTVPDGTVLFSLCFEILAGDGQTIDLDMQNVPGFDIEVFDGNGDQLSPSLINGSIEVSCAADPLQVSNVVIVDETCSGDMDGSIDITIEGGTPPYMFTWVGPNGFMSDEEDISGLESGFYTVAITDSSVPAQSIIRNYQIMTSGSTIQLDGFSTTGVSCKGDSTGIIDLTITGVGNSPMYTWGPGTWPDSPDLINAPAGSYQVTVTDEADCPVVFGPFTITEPFEALAITAFDVTDVDCHGEATGAIDITVANGTAPYTYEWSHLAGMSGDPEDPTGLEGGDYSVTVTDFNGCEVISGVFTVNEPPIPLTINDVTINPETAVTMNGSVEIIVSGGSGNYQYSWNGPSCSPCTTEDIFNLTAGNYTVIITDENGCTVTETYTVPFSMITLQIDTVIDVACEGNKTGAIQITVGGGEGPYEFNWQGPDNFGSALEDITGLGAGDYQVTITDLGAPGSFFTTTITVNTLSNLSIAASVESNYNGFGVSCFGSNDGMAVVEAFNGAQPYTFSWDNGATGEMIIDLSAGQYTVTVTDDVGCSRVASINLTQPTFIETDIQLMTEASCNDACDGEARIDPTGGLPPYSILWDNGQTTKQADSLCVGFHYVTVTDFNSCQYVDSLNIRQDEIVVTHEELADPNDPGRTTIRLDVTGGTRPYQYLWEDPVEDDDNFVSDLLPGLYRVLVVDANGCETLYEFTIESNPECFEDIRNVISPNDDGRNDTFIITCADIPTFVVRLEIYNRWGQLVFDTEDYQNNWNGVSNSQEPLPDGVYFYFFEVDMGLPSPSTRRQGSITLLR